MILKKYEHIEVLGIPKLSRQNIAGERHYVNEQGNTYPSITTILSIRGKEAIYKWRKRVGNEEANRITKLNHKGYSVPFITGTILLESNNGCR